MPDADDLSALHTQTGWSRVLMRFRDWIKPQPGWLILDAGCGLGLPDSSAVN